MSYEITNIKRLLGIEVNEIKVVHESEWGRWYSGANLIPNHRVKVFGIEYKVVEKLKNYVHLVSNDGFEKWVYDEAPYNDVSPELVKSAKLEAL